MSYQPRILAVDDEPQICESLEILLKKQGYDISTTNSGREALNLLDSGRFDLLLLDMSIPDLSGFEIMDHINRQDYEIFTIVITGNASIESAVNALKKGAFDYLKKPFEYEELLKRVGNALNQKILALEKKIINGKLERSEERYQYLVQNSPDIIYMLDSRGVFTFVNITAQRLLGFPPDQLKGKAFASIVHEKDLEKAASFLNRKEAVGPAAAQVELRLKVHGKSDLYKLFELEHSKVELSTAENAEKIFGIYGVARDITYRKQLEEQLQHAKKMEALGTLAGGIAHDFNNILMGIMGYASLLISGLDPSVPNYKKLKSIEQHVRSGAGLTKQLLSFARGGTVDIRPANINSIIDKTSSMFGRTKKEIKINCTYQQGLRAVEVDEGQIEQALLNLYLNAWQAMPGGGSVYLETQNCNVSEQPAKQLNLRPGNYVKTTVRDTGAGMDEETRQRVFEPFFTTKESTGGTGLGLASAYGIIKNHSGNITVQSK
jgi:PAS domain S-box-containing protein